MEALYSATDPVLISKYQRALQDLQRSEIGYCMAQSLLQNPSPNCRYFGALTFTVVIQTNTFTPDTYGAILAEMLARVGDFSALSGHQFIVRKLLSNISLLYVKTSGFFSDPVEAVLGMLMPGRRPAAADPATYAGLARDQWLLLLSFLTVLVEDIAKLQDFRAPVHRHVRHGVFPCLEAVYGCLARSAPDPPVVLKSLECLASWMAYIPNASADFRYDDIGVFLHYLMRHLFSEDLHATLEASNLCLSVFNDILELNAPLIPVQDKNTLYQSVCGPWGERYVEKALDNISPFVDIFLTILQLTCVRLAKTILDPESMSVVSFALRLSEFPGVPCIEDTVSERMLLFWEDFAAVFQESPETFEDLDRDVRFVQRKNDIFRLLSQVYWKKAHVPDHETYREIFHEFNAYRSNVSDYFLVLYSILKLELYETMVLSLAGMDAASYPAKMADIDATLYLLFKINDDSVYFESQTAPLAELTLRLYESLLLANLLATLSAHSLQAMTPFYLQTLVRFLSSTEFFLKTERGRPFLKPVFETLLPVVQVRPDTSQVQHTATALLALKSVTKICEECSLFLVPMLPDLEKIVVLMLKDHTYDALVRLRMFNAYSVIALNIADLGHYAQVLHGMILAIAAAAAETLKETSTFPETQDDYVISLLSCLVNIAKGSVHSDEAVEQMSEQQKNQYREFWRADPAHIKPLIASIIEEFSFKYQKRGYALVIEKCTLVMKVGFGESLGGPFEMGPQVISEYCVSVMQALAGTRASAHEAAPEPLARMVAVPHVYGLMQCLISTSYRVLEPELVHGLMRGAIVDFLSMLGQDPDAVKAAVDVSTTVFEKKPGLFLYSPDLSKMLEFLLDCLHANEASVVKSALKFWYVLLLRKNGTQQDAQFLSQILVDHGIGDAFTQNLVSSFVQAPRSNLEHFYQTFRALIGKYSVHAKHWLLKALDGKILPKMGEKDTTLFLQKLLVTRGRRTANDVLRDFWLQTNGMVDYNAR